MEFGKCSKCDCGKQRLIVNKHFNLCEEKNFERLHQGRSRLQVQAEHRRAGQYVQQSVQLARLGDKQKGFKSQKKRKRISQVSKTNRFRCSTGELVTGQEINERLKVAYNSIDQSREPVCQGTGRSDLPLSHSHTISQARCKVLGKTELIWDEDNIELESMGDSNAAHVIWENGNLEQKKTLLNFTRKLQYIKLHDLEMYEKFKV